MAPSNNFLHSCRSLYLKGIYPFDFTPCEDSDYQRQVALGRQEIQYYGLQAFLGYLIEGQYYVNLWAALVGLEYGSPDEGEILQIAKCKSVVEACLDTVVSHHTSCNSAQQKALSAAWIFRMKARYNII